jgi:hypothetical protein
MSVLRSYAQLVRLGNVPSALGDIALGALAVAALPDRWPAFLALLAASACLYMAGMVFNDYFDLEEDRHDRPSRPLPAGRISLRAALLLGSGLLTAGVLLAALAGGLLVLAGHLGNLLLPVAVALGLVVVILLYDAWLKHTWLGPLAMGMCRFLNVLLGVTLSGSLAWPLGVHVAGVVGLYIVGVTWFARSETRVSNQTALLGAVAVMLLAFALALPLPMHYPLGTASPLFPYLLVALVFYLGFPVRAAVVDPSPKRVQAAIGRCLRGLILLDAVLATATAGSVGLVLLVLLIPSLYLARMRWLYAT